MVLPETVAAARLRQLPKGAVRTGPRGPAQVVDGQGGASVVSTLFTPGGIMALRLDDKKALVAEVAEVAANAQSVVAAEYRGLSVTQMTKLRSEARNAGVYLRVVKNTLARRAIAGTQFECVGDTLKGPLVLAFSKDDPGAAARLVKDFAKDNDKLKPTALSLGGSLLAAQDLDRV